MDNPYEVTAYDIAVEAAALVTATLIAIAVYRAMSKPRLRLVPVTDGTGQWRTTVRDAALYTVTIPFLVLLWNWALGIVLVATPTQLSGGRIITVAAAVVLAARLLAHVTPEASHELAKAVPLTLVVLVLIRGQSRDLADVQSLLQDLAQTTESGVAILLVLTADLLFTAAWYLIGVRYLAGRGVRVPGVPPRVDVPGTPPAGRISTY